MAFHSFSLHRVSFFQGGWLPGNSKYNWRNGFIWRESLKQGEGTEHHARTELRISLRNPHLFRRLLRKLHTIFYFCILSCPVSISCKKGRWVQWSLKAAFLGWCLPSKEPLLLSHAGREPGGENLLDCASQVPGCSPQPQLYSHLSDSFPSHPVLTFSLFLLSPLTAMELMSIFF